MLDKHKIILKELKILRLIIKINLEILQILAKKKQQKKILEKLKKFLKNRRN